MQDIYFIFTSIIIGLSLLVILIINSNIRNNIIKVSFLLFSIIFSIIILVFDTSYILTLLNYLIKTIWYPDYLIFVSISLISIIVLIYTLLNNKLFLKEKITNYSLFSINYSIYMIFNASNIDVTSYTSLYSSKSLLLLRMATISFLVWLILTLIFKILTKLKRSWA